MKKLIALSLIFALSVISLAARPAPPPTGLVIPVICYHSITNDSTDHYATKLSVFKEELAYLNSNGYTALSADEYYNIMNGLATAPNKPILLTFDDCYADFYTNAYPELKLYGMKATIFIVSGWLDQAGRLTSDQLRVLAADSIDVQNHTVTHDYLSRMTTAQINTEIGGCNDKISPITGKAPQFVAYPYGDYDTDVVTIEKSLGIKMAFVVGGGNTTPSDDQFSLGRIIMTNSDTLSSFIRKLP